MALQEHAVQCWDRVLENLRQHVNEQTFETWFEQTEFVSLDDDALHLQGPNQFFVDWLTEHHLELIERVTQHVLGRAVRVRVRVNPKPAAVNAIDSRALDRVALPLRDNERPLRAPSDAGLNPRYTFENFVVGENNLLAHAASQAVGENPAMAYNPLFLYGGAGLGKTHLMQAIGQFVLENDPRAVVHYVSAENFMNELIQAIRTGRTYEFKNRYRNVDLLLIDDIQFLAGKESTQQEFFHTFNALYDANKQIVVTSDRPPKEIPTLEERLRSRFEWGLITDVQAPKFETRMAILKKKVEKEATAIPEDVLVLVAESIQSNIRELEGALIRLLAFSSLTGSQITLPMAQDVLSEILQRRKAKREVSMSDIIKAVSQRYGISIDVLRSKLRSKPVAYARQVAMYLCRENTKGSLNAIGRKFGGRDHTTVYHAWQKVAALEATNPEVRGELRDVLSAAQEISA